MKKNNAWNIRRLVDEAFVPSTQRASILYWRLLDFSTIRILRGFSAIYRLDSKLILSYSIALVPLIPSWLVWSEINCTVQVAFFIEPVQYFIIRQQTLKAYCPNIYTVSFNDLEGKKSHNFWREIGNFGHSGPCSRCI